MFRRAAAIPALLAVLLSATACEHTPTATLDLAGTYILTSINGQALPYIFTGTGATKVEALDDSFTLNPFGTYSQVGHKRWTADGITTVTIPVDGGNYNRRGEEIVLESLMYGLSTATIRDGVLTVSQQGYTLVYKR